MEENRVENCKQAEALQTERMRHKLAELFPEYHFGIAGSADEEAVMQMYHAMIGTEGCTWDYAYPNVEIFRSDVAENRLFCLKDDADAIIAVISIDRDPLVEALPVWKGAKPGGELARLAVREDHQNRGIARKMILAAMEILRMRGYGSAHYLVSKTHAKALASYAKLEFSRAGESNLYDHEWYCYEKTL